MVPSCAGSGLPPFTVDARMIPWIQQFAPLHRGPQLHAHFPGWQNRDFFFFFLFFFLVLHGHRSRAFLPEHIGQEYTLTATS